MNSTLNIAAALDQTRVQSIHFNKTIFGHVKCRIRKLEARLQGIQSQLQVHFSHALSQLESRLKEELEVVLQQEEFIWFQKSRVNWPHFGDRNTKFFHAHMMVRRQFNRITSIRLPSGDVCSDPQIIQTEALNFFKDMFTVEGSSVQHSENLQPLQPVDESLLMDLLEFY